jgi:hypothetical protein
MTNVITDENNAQRFGAVLSDFSKKEITPLIKGTTINRTGIIVDFLSAGPL